MANGEKTKKNQGELFVFISLLLFLTLLRSRIGKKRSVYVYDFAMGNTNNYVQYKTFSHN